MSENYSCYFFFPSNSYLHHMESGNGTQSSNFLLLLGLSGESELQPLIFGLFLFMYLITVFGTIYTCFSSESNLYLSIDYLQPWCKRTFVNKSHSLKIASIGESVSPWKESFSRDYFPINHVFSCGNTIFAFHFMG